MEELKAAYVVVNEEERLATMMEGIRAIEGRAEGKAVTDDALIQEILYITEYPYALMGRFEAEYLDLPRAVLVNVMKGHQRYIPLERPDGTLLPAFIFFANTIPKDPEQVIHGNEKVLRARLADARFFFDEDRKVKLETLYDRLSAVVFHERLGNLKEKSERIRADRPLRRQEHGRRPAICEEGFRSVEGRPPHPHGRRIPGAAGHHGKDLCRSPRERSEDVAQSIEEHYYPVGTSGALPGSDLGTVMALLTRWIRLVAFFSVGITPTGNLDPFALRRQAFGIIKIVVNRGLHIPLQELISIALQCAAG